MECKINANSKLEGALSHFHMRFLFLYYSINISTKNQVMHSNIAPHFFWYILYLACVDRIHNVYMVKYVESSVIEHLKDFLYNSHMSTLEMISGDADGIADFMQVCRVYCMNCL